MKPTRDTLGALVLFALCAAYGLEATRIALFPGQESEPFKPNTLPYTLALLGMGLTLLQILRTFRASGIEAAIGWRGFDWRRTAGLCGCMLAYGFLLSRLGFVAATALFLAGGFLLLGERRVLVLLLLPAGFSFAFWLMATGLLGLYLPTGRWLAAAAG
ncbi:MAG: tripartite tricarboxylate transporter TctB family protein [Gammaproteobacteria bacterium]|nr:tripartite tricarboxylate transporter TctB family protein [Gammaproteobacteria bacterium]MDH4254074.1 tripartite tricarboxylate transporter TctB family protein [Gammaproteobacteria bacterium]MDH5310484.1 tripartite tricarboxylate transporter TctB family protein [Gammaproteobacteria bacterium]